MVLDFLTKIVKNNAHNKEVAEAKARMLRRLTIKELKNLANKYGVVPRIIDLDENPRRAYGLALIGSLDYEIIRKEIGVSK